MKSVAIFPLLALLAGASIMVQSALNANLRAALASWSWAALVSYVGGTAVMLTVIFLQGGSRPAIATITSTPLSAWTGGLFGAAYIVLSIVALPRLGATQTVAFVVTGQMLTSLVFDQFGLMGLTQQPLTPVRITAALFIVVGVVLIRL